MPLKHEKTSELPDKKDRYQKKHSSNRKEEKMESNMESMKHEITPVRLRLELKEDYLSDYQKRMLKRYGESISGDSITRDILIPSDMPLHNLHYTIQKAFGWQNTHLRSFYLPEKTYNKLTAGTVKGWTDLVGVLFQPPSEWEYDVFWDDDYDGGSFKAWLSKKYTGPYIYGGILEDPEVARQDVEELLEQFKVFEVRESFEEYMKREKDNKDKKVKILKIAPLIELTLEEMNSSIILEGGTESLLERLVVDEVIASQDEDINLKEIFPVTKELIYNYDYGDNWIVKISKYKDCEDLIKNNDIDEHELEEAKKTVISKHRPVCINKVGLSVLDDVGGLGGFANFLGTIYEGEDKEEVSNVRDWAKRIGWNAGKTSNKKML